MTFIKKYWWIVLILTAVCFLLFRGCKAGPDHSGDKSALDSLNAADQIREKEYTLRIDSLSGVVRVKDRVIDSLTQKKDSTEKVLAVRGHQLETTLQALDAAKQRKDTVGIVSNCDSLEMQVVVDKAVIQGYEAVTDTLISQQHLASIAQDSISSNWKSLFIMADSARQTTMNSYNSLYADYNKVNRRLKFSNVLGKVGAGVIAALAIGLLIKK